MLNALTIPEGSTRWGIAQAVDEATDGRISADDFLAATADASAYAEDYSFLGGAGTNSLEGFLFPKTYDITADATAESVTRLMLDQFETEIEGMAYSDLVADYSWYDIVKLASIVEKEAPGRRAHPQAGGGRVHQPSEQRSLGLRAAKRCYYRLRGRPRSHSRRPADRRGVQHLSECGSAPHAHLQSGSGVHRGRLQPRPRLHRRTLLLLLRAR